MRNTNDALIARIQTFCKKYNLLQKGDKILLAVSGGSDSTALLHIFVTLRSYFNLELSAAHLNHGMRRDESDSDQALVVQISESLGITCYFKKIPVGREREKNESLEEAARRIRYRFLYQTLEKIGYDKIATGHTLDDNIETILYRLTTGTGPVGVVGIHPISQGVIHPLIEIRKDELLRYMHCSGLEYRVDDTNFNRDIPRNQIRHEIIPHLEIINKRYRDHMDHFAQILKEENELVDAWVHDRLEELIDEKNETFCVLNYKKFMSLPNAIKRRIIIKVYDLIVHRENNYKKKYLPFKVLSALCAQEVDGNKIIYRSNVITLKKVYNRLVFEKSVVDTGAKRYLYHVNSIETPVHLVEIGKELVFSLKVGTEIFDKDTLNFDYGKLEFPMSVRSRESGDMIDLKDVGHKKLKDLFIDHKVFPDIRDTVPILESGDEVVGVFCSIYGKDNRVAHGYRVTSNTEQILRVELRDKSRN
jgi:tRNA(Ile)-lysidine synthase